MNRFRRPGPAKIGLMIVIGIAAFVLFGSLVMLLWNAVLPGVFRLPLISFWQAIGLLVLARILFGRHGRPAWAGYGRCGWRMRHFRKKWEQMSPEEQERFRASWTGKCGSFAGEKAAG